MHAVAHGDAVLIFGVVGADVLFRGSIGRGLLGAGKRQGKKLRSQNGEDETLRGMHRRMNSPDESEYAGGWGPGKFLR